jgi:hypothetical protein
MPHITTVIVSCVPTSILKKKILTIAKTRSFFQHTFYYGHPEIAVSLNTYYNNILDISLLAKVNTVIMSDNTTHSHHTPTTYHTQDLRMGTAHNTGLT